jgi:hypothetical protein
MSGRGGVHAIVLLAFGACGPGGTPDAGAPDARAASVTELVGEVHLHQFPRGSHAWAAFLRDPLPAGVVHSHTIVDLEPPASEYVGACALYETPRCDPPCGSGTWCAATDRCAPLEPLVFVDGGEVRVAGSTVVPEIRMWFESEGATYLSSPAPGDSQLFAGGDLLGIQGGRGELAFAVDVRAPLAVEVTSPDLSAAVSVQADRDFEIVWASAGQGTVVVTLLASRDDGRAAHIRCLSADAGALSIARALLARLPPPPRSMRLEVDRDEERVAQVARRGAGVLVHVTQTTWKNWRE